MFRNTIKIGIITAILSFAIGTILLITFLLSGDIAIAIFGYTYLIGAFIVNLIIALFFLIISQNKIEFNNRKKYYKTIKIMLINIPIAFIYFLIVINL